MNNLTMRLLYDLLDFLPDYMKDEDTIIRLDLAKDVPPKNLKLVVVTKSKYYYYFIDENDLTDYETLFKFVLDHMLNDPNPIPRPES